MTTALKISAVDWKPKIIEIICIETELPAILLISASLCLCHLSSSFNWCMSPSWQSNVTLSLSLSLSLSRIMPFFLVFSKTDIRWRPSQVVIDNLHLFSDEYLVSSIIDNHWWPSMGEFHAFAVFQWAFSVHLCSRGMSRVRFLGWQWILKKSKFSKFTKPKHPEFTIATRSN